MPLPISILPQGMMRLRGGGAADGQADGEDVHLGLVIGHDDEGAVAGRVLHALGFNVILRAAGHVHADGLDKDEVQPHIYLTLLT